MHRNEHYTATSDCLTSYWQPPILCVGPIPSCIEDHKMIIPGYEELDSHDKGKWEHKFFTNYSKFFFGLTFDLLIILPAAFSLERVG